MDMEMPGDTPKTYFAMANYWNGTIQEMHNNGSIPMSKLNDMLARILTPYFFLNQDQGYPSVDPGCADLNQLYPPKYRYDFNLTGQRDRNVQEDHASLIRSIGAQAATLLKNVNGALPLKTPKRIGVFGSDAADVTTGEYGPQQEVIGTLPIGGGSGMMMSLLVQDAC
jgi:beta-glucosidase